VNLPLKDNEVSAVARADEMTQIYGALVALRKGDASAKLPHHGSAAFSRVAEVFNDLVVSNLATQRLINSAPFIKANAAGFAGVAAGSGRWVHFLSGSHGSLLDPTASLAVTAEMQNHAVTLALTGGAAFQITPAGSALLEP